MSAQRGGRTARRAEVERCGIARRLRRTSPKISSGSDTTTDCSIRHAAGLMRPSGRGFGRIAYQVNGKLRARLVVGVDAGEADVKSKPCCGNSRATRDGKTGQTDLRRRQIAQPVVG